MPPVIALEKLTKSYGKSRGIIEVDLEVQQSEIFGFLGPNGAGKTTTIRTMLDLIRPTSGRATVFGIESTADPVAIHRRIGYIPGEFALYDRLTGKQTLEYFANLRGGVDQAYQASLIERFDLDTGKRFKTYSKGNKQKVGVIAALQHRPDLLVLDEPTSGLDPLVQQTFFETLRETVADGATVFLSSHILSEVEKTCGRVAITSWASIAIRSRQASSSRTTAPSCPATTIPGTSTSSAGSRRSTGPVSSCARWPKRCWPSSRSSIRPASALGTFGSVSCFNCAMAATPSRSPTDSWRRRFPTSSPTAGTI